MGNLKVVIFVAGVVAVADVSIALVVIVPIEHVDPAVLVVSALSVADETR